MDGSEVKALFEEIIDDTWDETSVYLLMTNAQEILEDERDWYILEKKDTSITRSAGDTYETSNDLPSDFSAPKKVFVGTEEFDEIAMDDQIDFRNSEGYYWIDYANSKIYFSGTASQSKTVTLFYRKAQGEITSSTTLVWPGKRGAYLAYRMAEIYSGGIDGDDINFAMSQKQEDMADMLYQGLVQWDAKIRLKAIGGRTKIRQRTTEVEDRIRLFDN